MGFTRLIYLGLCVIFLVNLVVIVQYSLSMDDKQKRDLKLLQKTLIFQKPSIKWEYNNSWRYIGSMTYGYEIFSAYLDMRVDAIANMDASRNQILVGHFHIFAIFPLLLKDKIRCITRYDDFRQEEAQALAVQQMQEHHSKGYGAYAVLCPFSIKKTHQIIELPFAIAITLERNTLSKLSKTFVPISYPRQIDQMFQQSRLVLSICVGIMFDSFSQVLRLVEFVEIYRILGAGHFYFYVQDASEDVRKVLRYYQSIGLADVISWNLHQTDIHYKGQLAQINDCIYRANIVDNYRYAMAVDVDEILMPLKHNSLLEFLKQCDEGFNAAFVFRNVFFYKKDSDDAFSTPMHAKNRFLYTQMKVRRTLEVMPPKIRSKCIVNTKAIVEMGIHQKWSAIKGYTDFMVHPSVGLLFHYRDKCINCKSLLIVDYTARKIGSLIWDRVDEICLEVFLERRGICPIG